MGSSRADPAPGTALDAALARIGRRFGTAALQRGAWFEGRSVERTLRTGTAFDRLAGGIALGAPCVFAGTGTSGKLALALRAVAAAQRDGAHAMWVDPSAALDPRAARQTGVDLDRLLVVRARTRDDALFAAAAGLRSGGFRLVALDTGPALLPGIVAADDVGPLLPLARGSVAALLVVSDPAPARLALPVFRFARLDWENEGGRTTGWTFTIAAAGGARVVLRLRAGALMEVGPPGAAGRAVA